METVKFKRYHEDKWKTLKHLGKPFTDMREAIKYVRHNNAEWGLQLKLWDTKGEFKGMLQWDNL
jgi:hypothetical protein